MATIDTSWLIALIGDALKEAHNVAKQIDRGVGGREISLCITKLEEARHRAVDAHVLLGAIDIKNTEQPLQGVEEQHLYTESDPSHRTIAHMAQYLAPVLLNWVKSLGIDENTPLEWNISNEVLRDRAQEAEHPGYKCFKPGKHMTLSITHAGTIHTQHFVRTTDNTWRVDTRY